MSSATGTLKILIMARAFIRIITFHKEGGGHLLEAATVFDNSWKNFDYLSFPPMTTILISEVYTSFITDVFSIV